MACVRYSLPPRQVKDPHPALLEGTPVNAYAADFTDELMVPQYHHHYPTLIPPCSLRLGTLSVNGSLQSPARDTPAILSHLMQSAAISVFGITDARFSATEVDQVKTAFRHYLPRGTALIAFPTERPYTGSHRNTTMGGQLIILNVQWEKWAGHHRSDPSGLSLVVGIRITYNGFSLSVIQEVMVPPKSPGPHTMWQRLSKYLAKTTNSALRPDEFVIQTAEKWAVKDTLAGRTVAIMGDFNKSYASLASWAAVNYLTSLSRDLYMARPGDNFTSFNGTTTVKPSLIDHVFLQDGTSLTLNSVGGLMHPTLSLVTDHNPLWARITWPDNPPLPTSADPSPRIVNALDLPEDEETRDIFSCSLDSKLEFIMAGSWPLETLSPERAGELQGSIAQASVQTAKELSPPKLSRRTGKGHRFKDGYSPEFLLLCAALRAYTDISRLLWRHVHRAGRPHHHDTELALIMDRWYRVLDAHPEATDHPHWSLFPSNITLAKYRKEHIMEKIAALKRLLHGRQRKRMRIAMSERVREMEALLEAKKLGKLIQKLLPDYTDPLDFNQLKDEQGTPSRVHRQFIGQHQRPCRSGWESRQR